MKRAIENRLASSGGSAAAADGVILLSHATYVACHSYAMSAIMLHAHIAEARWPGAADKESSIRRVIG